MDIFRRGSAIAKIIGNNVVNFPERFEEKVSMWVFEELVDGKKLTEIINETHENVKYLPNHKLPSNVVSSMVIQMKIRIFFFSFYEQVAIPDLLDAAKDADILVFVVPHQFITRLCDQLSGNIKSTAIGLSLIKVS